MANGTAKKRSSDVPAFGKPAHIKITAVRGIRFARIAKRGA
jgi:hypothetical protein